MTAMYKCVVVTGLNDMKPFIIVGRSAGVIDKVFNFSFLFGNMNYCFDGS